jgi:hypothetical protein
MKEHPDINDTLRSDGPDAVRARHDKAHKFAAREPEQQHCAQRATNGRGDEPPSVTVDDFLGYMPMHNYIYAPTGETWPASSVNARVAPVDIGAGKTMPASAWIDKHRPVEQMTWAPGEPTIIRDKLVLHGGWIRRVGSRVFNHYRPPSIAPGNADKAGPWIEHVRRVYPDEFERIIRWLAQRVQHPEIKINHALVLGGAQGIGKDTLLEPIKRAVGPWNISEVSPQQTLGRFNGFLKSVIIRVNEARDLGDVDRFNFYDHTKSVITTPPDTLRVDEKFLPNIKS